MSRSPFHQRRASRLAALLTLVAGTAGATEFRQLTFYDPAPTSGASTPAWSPNSRRIAFTRWTQVGVFESWIGLVDAAGGDVMELPGQRPGSIRPYNSDPAWSPAGDRIACAIGAVIGTYPAAGGPPSYPNANLTNARDPAWSPDGRRFAFRQGDGIYTMPVGGGAAVRLTTGFDSDPAWSPDGRWIAFESLRSGNRDIWLVPSAGGEVVQLTHAPGSDTYPAWSPDGRLIAFTSDRAGNDDIWVVRVATGAVSQVTNDPASDHSPGWSPDGTRIAFASDRSGALNLWIASDLRTVAVAPATWSRIKLRAR